MDKSFLKLQVADWREWADRVKDGFMRAARFLRGQKIFRARDLPYRTQLVPLAAIFVSLGPDGDTEGARQKIAQWYWCGVLGELYGGSVESRFAHDLPEVISYMHGEANEVDTIQKANFQAGRLLTLRTRNSAAYKGLYALLMRDGGRDFRTGEPIETQTFFNDKMDIHHIFPEKWCKANGIKPGFYNSIVNKTVLSSSTNRQIGGHAPSRYLPAIEKKAEVNAEKMDDILRSHCIAPEHLRANDFWAFFEARADALLERIEAATGKIITREPALFQTSAEVENNEEEPEDWEDEEAFEEPEA